MRWRICERAHEAPYSIVCVFAFAARKWNVDYISHAPGLKSIKYVGNISFCCCFLLLPIEIICSRALSMHVHMLSAQTQTCMVHKNLCETLSAWHTKCIFEDHFPINNNWNFEMNIHKLSGTTKTKPLSTLIYSNSNWVLAKILRASSSQWQCKTNQMWLIHLCSPPTNHPSRATRIFVALLLCAGVVCAKWEP